MSTTRRRTPRSASLLVGGLLVLSACAADADTTADTADTAEPVDIAEGAEPGDTTERGPVFRYPPAPAAPTSGAADAPEVRSAMGRLGEVLRAGGIDGTALDDVVEYGDARHAWYVADLMRFFGAGDGDDRLVEAFEALTGASLDDDPDSERSVWLSATNHLIAWDTPDYPAYRDDKSVLFLLVEPAWEPFFADTDSDIDWRHLSWGGVLIDDRELGDPDGCPGGCIPALDDPATTDAEGGAWYPDDAVVFGIVDGRGLRDQHHGNAVADVVATVEPRVVEQGLALEVIERALVLRAGEDLEERGIECHGRVSVQFEFVIWSST